MQQSNFSAEVIQGVLPLLEDKGSLLRRNLRAKVLAQGEDFAGETVKATTFKTAPNDWAKAFTGTNMHDHEHARSGVCTHPRNILA